MIVTNDKIFGSVSVHAVRASPMIINENSLICATVSPVIKLSLGEYHNFIMSVIMIIGLPISTNHEKSIIGSIMVPILSKTICPPR
jgi:hypothetical protein